MTVLVALLNLVMTKLFDAICWPFLGLNPIWALVVISLLTGILMLWIWGKISNQEAIKRIKNKIRGNLIGVRLFQEDLGVTMRLQGKILRDTLIYMKYAVSPMLVMLIPVIGVMIQLNLRFSVRPLKPGEPVLLKVKVHEGSDLSKIALRVPEGVKVETPGVRIESEKEVAWRVRPTQPGIYRLDFHQGEAGISKTLVVGPRWAATPSLQSKRFVDLLLYPGEKPIPPSSPLESIKINYPPLKLPLWGWNIHWLVYFFVLSIVFAFAFKGILGVEI